MADAQSIRTRLTELVEGGQHLDEVPGLPGVALDDEGTFRADRRLYYRGTEEHSYAIANGLLDRLPPPPPPASPEAIAEAELLAGSAMAPILRRLYGLATAVLVPATGG